MHLRGLVVRIATPSECLDLNGRATANWLAARWLWKLNGAIGGHSFAKCSMRDRVGGLHRILGMQLAAGCSAAELQKGRSASVYLVALDVVPLARGHCSLLVWFFDLPRYGRPINVISTFRDS